jgi:GT2 family glycosyltransferase
MHISENARRRLDVVIVTWNHGILVDRCLSSIAQADGAAALVDRVIVIDNASAVPYAAPRGFELPLTIVRNTLNVGFAAASNQGAALGEAELILFLNPDTCISTESLSIAIEAFDSAEHRRTAIVGLPLVDDAGVVQPTCGRELTALRIVEQNVGLTTLAPNLFSGMRLRADDHRASRFVDSVSGACLFIRRSLFEILGGFDEDLVVYLEDADLALRARMWGWRAYFVAAAPVFHENGWKSGRDRPWRIAHASRSAMTYAWKHFSVAGALAVTATMLLLAPLARAAAGIVRGRWREVIEVAQAFAALGHLLRARSRAKSTIETFLASDGEAATRDSLRPVA